MSSKKKDKKWHRKQVRAEREKKKSLQKQLDKA